MNIVTNAIKQTAIVALVGGAMALAGSSVQAAVTADVKASPAPNTFGSPNYTTWEANAMTALTSGASTVGTPGTPGQYTTFADGQAIDQGNFVVTNFNSWKGEAPPTSFGPNFANEVGTRLHYPAHITGNGAQFSIDQIGFKILYNDAAYTDYSVFNVAPGAYTYATTRVGLNYGTDGIKGTGDDQWITSGASSQLIDELFTRGSGLGYEVNSDMPGATNQDKIDQYLATYFGTDPYSFSGTYYLGSTVIGDTTQNFNVPEPAGLAAIALVGTGLLARRRRNGTPNA